MFTLETFKTAYEANTLTLTAYQSREARLLIYNIESLGLTSQECYDAMNEKSQRDVDRFLNDLDIQAISTPEHFFALHEGFSVSSLLRRKKGTPNPRNVAIRIKCIQLIEGAKDQ